MTPLEYMGLSVLGLVLGWALGKIRGYRCFDPRATRSYRRDAALLKHLGGRTDHNASTIKARLAAKYPPGYLGRDA